MTSLSQALNGFGIVQSKNLVSSSDDIRFGFKYFFIEKSQVIVQKIFLHGYLTCEGKND